jgi:hypothetical protein
MCTASAMHGALVEEGVGVDVGDGDDVWRQVDAVV